MNINEAVEKFKEIENSVKRLEQESLLALEKFFIEKNAFEVKLRGIAYQEGYNYVQVIATADEYLENMYLSDCEEMDKDTEKLRRENRKKYFLKSLDSSENIMLEENFFNEHLSSDDSDNLSSILHFLVPYFENKYDTNFEVTLRYDNEKKKLIEEKETYYSY